MFRLPIPGEWQTFEAVCHRLWRDLWCDPNALLNGRVGQPQNGVDIYGRLFRSRQYGGVQCKDKDTRLGAQLGEPELHRECTKARGFNPRLAEFTIATTAPRDVSIQKRAREMAQERSFPFSISVWSWDDIEAELVCRPDILRVFNWPFDQELLPHEVMLPAYAPRDRLLAFLSRPQIEGRFGVALKQSLIPLLYELSDNAFIHGRAQTVKLTVNGNVFTFIDDGNAFDPTTQLDSSRVTHSGYVGSLVFHHFVARHNVRYRRESTSAGGSNVLESQTDGSGTTDEEVYEHFIDPDELVGRHSGEDLSRLIVLPENCKHLVILLKSWNFPSATSAAIHDLDEHLPDDVQITVSCPRADIVNDFQ